MSATDVARQVKPHLWAGRHTRWGAQAWTETLDLVTAVLEAAGAQAAAGTRQDVFREAVAFLDSRGHHAAAEHLREEAGLPQVQDLTHALDGVIDGAHFDTPAPHLHAVRDQEKP